MKPAVPPRVVSFYDPATFTFTHVAYDRTGGHAAIVDPVLDFDPAVTGIASQPFWLRWHDLDGARVSHAPDFFARRADGSAVVVDCRPWERRGPRDMAKFEATGQACARVGWEYRLVGAADEIVPIETHRAVYDALLPHYQDHPEDLLFITHAGGHSEPEPVAGLGWDWLTAQVDRPTRNPGSPTA